MTKKEAIKQARREVTDLYRFGDGWTFNTYSEKHNAWFQGNSTNYPMAQVRRAEVLIEKALCEYYGCEPEDAYIPYEGGRWESYV